jgi:ABC-2 type transport system permease protein
MNIQHSVTIPEQSRFPSAGSSIPATSGPQRSWVPSAQVVLMLAWREWIRFFRQPFRVAAALLQPILFWVLFGTGMHSSFRGDSQSADFMTYFMPGTVAMILLFTSIFSTITIIEDRREGFLQSVLVAATPRWAIAIGKALGSAAIAWVQALVFLLMAIGLGYLEFGNETILLACFMVLVAVAVSSLAVCCAWPMNSTQEFHSVMNLVLMPMWLLSGAFFPVPAVGIEDAWGQVALHWVMRCNPMTYAVSGFRHLMFHVEAQDRYWVPSLLTSVWVTCAFASIVTMAAVWLVHRKQRGELS